MIESNELTPLRLDPTRSRFLLHVGRRAFTEIRADGAHFTHFVREGKSPLVNQMLADIQRKPKGVGHGQH